jgi:3-hydroxyacyl-CoA dehydrogenase/enoyl-CoA hydratase/3-hydroxybutyryl-CoA epimerase/enoyl-CoA isomerase
MYNGKTLSVSKIHNQFAELCFNNQDESVNKLDLNTTRELAEAVAILTGDSQIKGLLVTSKKSVFIVGADITEFSEMFKLPKDAFLSRVTKVTKSLVSLENLPFPTVVAINGYALGGGLEVCMACDYRVLSDKASIGMPEATLGIIPGFGGTVRLPRITDISTALEWMISGAIQNAKHALEKGAVDEVVPESDLRDVALEKLSDFASDIRDYKTLRSLKSQPIDCDHSTLDQICNTYRDSADKKPGRNYPAPLTLVETLRSSAKLKRESAQKLESEAFYSIAQTSQARAMVGIFLSDQYLAKQTRFQIKKQENELTKIRRSGIIGAGIMGGGIAYQNAIKGYSVLLKDIEQKALDLGMSEASKLLSKSIDREKIKPIDGLNILSKITPTLYTNGIETCDVIVEAIIENEEVKKTVLADIESAAREDSVITSNTSTISINRLASVLSRPENFCGLHFFNPVHAMPLVEIVRAKNSSDTTVAMLCDYVLGLGKKAVVVNDCPGFLVNRTLFAMLFGFEMLVQDGADFKQIDSVMEAWGWPMGPAYLIDVIGLDTLNHCYDSMSSGLPERFNLKNSNYPSRQIFSAGRLGQKNGRGYYQYVKGKSGRAEKQIDIEAQTVIEAVSERAKSLSNEEIVNRMMLPMANEMLRCLDEQIVASPEEADMALIYGLGFPRFRGGICRWMDEIGPTSLYDLGRSLEGVSALYNPPASLGTRAVNNVMLYQ